MRNKIITNLKSLDCDKNSHLLLAVSGGIDSMVMLHFFQQNKKQFKFSVAHINHNYHSESKKMENLVRACLLYTSPSPRDMRRSRMPSSA